MGRSQDSMKKKEVKTKNDKKRKEKEKRRLERKANAKDGTSFDSMIAYVDENGNITSTPPDPTKKVEINLEDIQIGVPRRAPEAPEDKIRKGVVTFFNDSKGYGFIKDSQNQQSVFVHVNDLTEEVSENNKVVFEIEKGFKGPKAVNVRIDR